MIDLTLDRLKRPAIPGLRPTFGTTVEVTDKTKGGLSTTEVDANIALAYELQREVIVSTSDETSIVEYNAKIAIVADEAVTLKMNGASYGGCDIKITNRGTATATVEYNESGSIQIPPDGYIRMEWTSREWWVEDTMNVQPVGANIKTFTYVVDSDQALIDWANNDRNRGQDYTSVLIKKGEWKSNTGVNLTQAGTKVVEGEADSKLVFNGVEKGLYYEEIPDGEGYYMIGVNIKMSILPFTEDTRGCFKMCCNLITCTATIDGYCGSSHKYPYCFSQCQNLTNCTGISEIRSYGSPQSFRECSNLNNCTAITSGANYPNGFYECSNLTNCTSTCNSIERGFSMAFAYCSNLTNCTGKSNGLVKYSQAYGFGNCSNLTDCTGVGVAITDSSPPGEGYAFNECTAVSHCKAASRCTTAVFYTCYASNSKTSTYACADTANGGFNNTTNPSA